MVTKSPSWIFRSVGTAWGILPLGPLATMGSKDIFSAPPASIRYCSRAAISFSVTPGLISLTIWSRAASAMRWAAIIRWISSSSLLWRREISSSVAGTIWQCSFSE